MVRVMIVDDSLTARNVFARLFENDDHVVIAAQASTAERALETLKSTEVDLILLDLEMPGMGGLVALPKLLAASKGAHILIVSALTGAGEEKTLQALALGATDTFPKPGSDLLDSAFREELKAKVHALGRRRSRSTLGQNGGNARQLHLVANRQASKSAAALAIAGSTGGIFAMCEMLKRLPPQIGIPIFVTQHLPIEFMDVFARQLSNACGREAFVAKTGMEAGNDQILVAPADAHLRVKCIAGRLIVDLQHGRCEGGCLPSADPMFASLAKALGASTIAVLLSGMGKDGALGAGLIAQAGGTVLAQDEESSAVWGMPGAVASLASALLPPEALADHISRLVEPQP